MKNLHIDMKISEDCLSMLSVILVESSALFMFECWCSSFLLKWTVTYNHQFVLLCRYMLLHQDLTQPRTPQYLPSLPILLSMLLLTLKQGTSVGRASQISKYIYLMIVLSGHPKVGGRPALIKINNMELGWRTQQCQAAETLRVPIVRCPLQMLSSSMMNPMLALCSCSCY
jgi:hypothetical protein